MRGKGKRTRRAFCVFVCLLGWQTAIAEEPAEADRAEDGPDASSEADRPRPNKLFRGRVLDPAGKPAGLVHVSVNFNPFASPVTDSDGRFSLHSLSKLERRPFRAVFRLPEKGLGAVYETDELPEKPIEVQLGRNVVTLSGRIVRPDKKALHGGMGEVMVQEELPWSVAGLIFLGERTESVTNVKQDGRYKVRAVPIGYVYHVSFSDSGTGGAYETVDLREAEPGTVKVPDIELPAAEGKVSGKVLGPDGQPAEGVRVHAVVQQYLNITCETDAKTDAQGRFSIDGIVDENPVRLYVFIPKEGPRGNIRGHAKARVGRTDVVIRLERDRR